MKKPVWVGACWILVVANLASAAVLTDNFNDNTMGTLWGVAKYAEQCPESSFDLIEISQRLEFRANLPNGYNKGEEFYYSNQWWLDINYDFSFKIGFHHPLASGYSELLLGITPSSVDVDNIDLHLYLSAENWGDEKNYYFMRDDGSFESGAIPRTANDGTLYISYATTTDTLYLGTTGYGQANALATFSGVLQGEWGGVPIYLGFGGEAYNGTIINAGQLYLDNFVLDSGVQIIRPTNVTCDQAIALTSGVAKNGTTFGTDSSEVWYSFTAGGDGLARVTVTPTDVSPCYYMVYDACEGNEVPLQYPGAEDGSTVIEFETIAGQRYLVYLSTGYNQDFSIRADFYASPANDNCNQAIALTAGVVKNGTTLGSVDRVVWYSFTAGGNGEARVRVTAPDAAPPLCAIYDACEGNMLPVDYITEDESTLVDFGTVAGQKYWIYIETWDSRNFSIRADFYAPPANDTCNQAIALTSGVSKNGYTIGAGDLDVWYSFTPAANGTAKISVTPSNSSFNPSLAFYEVCGEDAIGYIDDGYEGEPEEYGCEVAAGTKYLISVGGYSEGTFSIRVDFAPAGVTGDLCSQAIVLTKGVVRSATTVGATGYSSCNCGEDDTRDVWFKYTPTEEESVRVIVTEVGSFDSSVSVYNSCGGDPIACADNNDGGEGEELIFPGFAGESYWIRVAGNEGQTGAFSIVCKPVIFCPVSGVVSDKYSGVGIGWMEIDFTSNLEGYSYMAAITDDTGYYELTLPEGSYEVHTSNIDPYADILFQPVEISEGMGALNFQLAPAAVLDITVVDSVTAETVTDQFEIRVFLDTPDGDQSSMGGILDNLPEGLWRVQLRPYDAYSPPYPGSESWVYLHEGQQAHYLYTIEPGILVEGYVGDSMLAPLENATVYYSGKGGVGYTFTDYEGKYRIYLPAGDYGFAASYWCEWDSVWAQSPWMPATIPDTSGPITGPHFIVYEEELLSISGTIQNSGNYAKSGEFEVVVFQKDIVPSLENGYTLLWDAFWLANTLDAAGPFEISELPPGAYDIYLGIVSWNPEFKPSFTVRGRIRNIAAGASNIALSYTSVGSTVGGKIQDSRGNFILGAEMLLQTPTGGFAGWTRSDSMGRYSFTNVPAGSYIVSANHRKYITASTAITVPATSSPVTAASLKLTPAGLSEGADLNGDGYVNFDDFSPLMAHWLMEESAACDFDSSGTTDIVDLARMVESWLGQSIWLGEMPEMPVIPEGQIAHWLMDDNAASKTVVDSGGGNYNGTAQQNTAALTTAGRLNGALAFNGTGDWIDCGTNAALLPDAWTLCAWVKCTDTATPMLISFGGNYPSVKLQNNAKGEPLIHLGQYNYRYFAASAWTTLKDGQWHHVAFTVSGKGQADIEQAKMYLDGAVVEGEAALATGPQANKSHVYLGANPSIAAQRFGGAIDDLMLFGRALTESEIRKAMNRKP